MRKLVAATIVFLVTLLSALLAGGEPGADPSARGGAPDRMSERGEVLAVTSVSPWVTANGTFTVSFSASGLPPDAVVTTTIHQRLYSKDASVREVTESQIDGDAVPRNLQAPIATPLSDLLKGDGSATIVIPIRPDSGNPDRELVPTPGIHPVTVEVSAPGGNTVATATVFLNRLPEDMPAGRDGRSATTSVQLLAVLDSGPALGVDGLENLSAEESLAVSAWEEMLTENRDLPLTVALRPNTLIGLQRGDQPSDATFVSNLADTAFTVTAQSYVKVDAAAVDAAGHDALNHQIATGNSILTALTGAPPKGIWMFDDTLNTEVAKRLSLNGVNHLFASEDRFTFGPDVSPAERPTIERSRTFELAGAGGMTVSSYDAEVTRLLLDTDVPPGLSAHRAATALMASWFDAVGHGAESFPGVSSAIMLSPRTDHAVLAEFVSALSEPGPLGVSEPTVATVDDEGAPLVARLREREADPVTAVVDRWAATQRRITSFASMRPPADPTAPEWGLLNDQTVSLDADAETRSALWDHIDVMIDKQLATIQTPPPRLVVLPSRSGSIPLRIRNRGEVAMTVRMTTRSPRLEFPQGASLDVLLTPGENRIEIPVEVRAPGSSLLRIELTSPDGVLDFREVQVTVRSSSISGVGAVLSIISLVVLGLWWVLTLRRRGNGKDDVGENARDNADNKSANEGAGSPFDGSDEPGANHA